jgi:hypothetical protein
MKLQQCWEPGGAYARTIAGTVTRPAIQHANISNSRSAMGS